MCGGVVFKFTKALGTDRHTSCGDTGADGVRLPQLQRCPRTPQPLCWTMAAWGGGDGPTPQPRHPLLPSPHQHTPAAHPDPADTVLGWTLGHMSAHT